ncbi:unnamed protein product [Pleuronectes platessa]|uniref:Uncharacterized protein n=1 Tax=Pleuronectes platessa TaxID=8262 RepID=A0A9N7Z318_PLEPL|nr:unnamed protein product [Pleuronectes platessa]
MTRRRTLTTEQEETGLSWGEASTVARDWDVWKKLIAAICPTGSQCGERPVTEPLAKYPRLKAVPLATRLNGSFLPPLVHIRGRMGSTGHPAEILCLEHNVILCPFPFLWQSMKEAAAAAQHITGYQQRLQPGGGDQ